LATNFDIDDFPDTVDADFILFVVVSGG